MKGIHVLLLLAALTVASAKEPKTASPEIFDRPYEITFKVSKRMTGVGFQMVAPHYLKGRQLQSVKLLLSEKNGITEKPLDATMSDKGYSYYLFFVKTKQLNTALIEVRYSANEKLKQPVIARVKLFEKMKYVTELAL